MIRDCKLCGRALCMSTLECEHARGYRELADQDFEDRDTPIIDEGCVLRAKQIDWNPLAELHPSVVTCRSKHPPFRSHAIYDADALTIISQRPCPMCGSHDMRSKKPPDESIAVAGVIDDPIKAD